MEYFKFLPEEITLDILSRVLPIESALECKLVCKNWRYLVSHHQSFAKLHLHHQLNHPTSGKLGLIAITQNNKIYYLEYNEKHDQSTTLIEKITRFNFTLPSMYRWSWIVDSCNGLICVSEGNKEIVCICNPITKQYVVLSEVEIDCDTDVYFSYGFGFISSTNEYKVVRILHWTAEFIQVYVYTLGSGNGWRNLGKFDPAFSPRPWRQGIFANEALYWMNQELKLITTFDLAEEKFCQHLLPPPLTQESDWDMMNTIGVLDGFLFFAADLVVEEAGCNCEIWLLKQKNYDPDRKEEHQSMVWSREFKIDLDMLAASTKRNCVLTYGGSYLNIYDTKASTSKNIVDFKKQVGQVLPHRNTFVSLKELGEQDTKIMEVAQLDETESYDQPSIFVELGEEDNKMMESAAYILMELSEFGAGEIRTQVAGIIT